MIVAYVAGYETWAELFRRDNGLLHKKGWHPTGLYGAVGAAAACASLRRLDADKAAQAIALGASQSAGLMSNFGTMTKPFHAGQGRRMPASWRRASPRPASPPTPTRWSTRRASSTPSRPEGNPDRDQRAEGRQGVGDPDAGLGIKKYPTCYCTHRAIDCMLDLVAATPVEAGRGEEDHRQHQRLFRHRAAQPHAADRAGGEVQHGVRDGERHRGAARRAARADR